MISSELLDALDESYEKQLAGFAQAEAEDADMFLFDNKVLKNVIKCHVGLQRKWLVRLRDLEKITDQIEVKCQEVFSRRMSEVKRTSAISYSSTELKVIVEGDEDYLQVKTRLIRFQNLVDKTKDMVKVIDQRYWCLKDITTLVVNGADNFII